VWIDPADHSHKVFIDSAVAPPLQAGTTNVSAGNATVPAGFIRQVGWDGYMDTGAWNFLNGQPQLNIFIPGVPYYTAGWPPDPLLGQPYHTPQNVNRKDGIQD
jgi:hypothetical protein